MQSKLPVATVLVALICPASGLQAQEDNAASIGGYGEMLFRSDDSGDTLDLYRAIVYVGYQFDSFWSFTSEIEVEHQNEIAMEQAFLQYDSGNDWGVRFGHMLVPMGLINEFHEPTTFWSANRPQTERLILPSTWHENGVGGFGRIGDFDWRAYALTGFDAAGLNIEESGMRDGRQNGSSAAADNLALTARLDYRGITGLLLGVSMWSGDSGQAGSDEGFATTIWDVHGQYDQGPLRIRGVWADAEVEDAVLLPTSSASDSLSGWYIEAGWDLFAGRDFANQAPQALTPFVRFESIDLQADILADTAEDRTTIGLAWQPHEQIIFKLDWTAVDSADGNEDVVQAAMGYVF